MQSLLITPIPLRSKVTVTIPGSKSYTNRALLLAAMTKGSVRIERPLISDDTLAMVSCLRTLGLDIQETKNSITVRGDISQIAPKDYTLDANLSGTTIRFVLALATVIPGAITLTGGEGLRKRPIGNLVDGLRQMGAEIEYLDKEGHPPLRITSSKLHSGTVRVSGEISSQYLSAMLMIAPMVASGITIKVTGAQISKPYIDMTLDAMEQFGVQVDQPARATYYVAGGQAYHASKYIVEGDASSAGYFFAIAALTHSTITLKNINPDSAQADMEFLEILETMGAKIQRGKNQVTVAGHGVKPLEINMQDCPDQVMTAAVLAAFAPGTTHIAGVQSLRVKETERVVALEKELAKMGIRTSSTKNTLNIHGGTPLPAAIDTYGDHRMAMAFAVAGTYMPGIVINNPEVVSKTFPEFWDVLRTLQTRPKADNIVLIGMRGSGKTTSGRLLAERLGKSFLDLDAMLEQHVGMTLSEFVKTHGWERFRDEESGLTERLAGTQNAVISTGGGVIIRAENTERLRSLGPVVLLETSPVVIVSRIKDATDRAPLTSAKNLHEEISQVLRERKHLYHSASDIRVHTDRETPEQIVVRIIQDLNDMLS